MAKQKVGNPIYNAIFHRHANVYFDIEFYNLEHWKENVADPWPTQYRSRLFSGEYAKPIGYVNLFPKAQQLKRKHSGRKTKNF